MLTGLTSSSQQSDSARGHADVTCQVTGMRPGTHLGTSTLSDWWGKHGFWLASFLQAAQKRRDSNPQSGKESTKELNKIA